MTEITAKTKEHPELVRADYDLPEDFDGLVAKFGNEVVASAAHAQIKISLQSYMRANIDKSAEELQSLVSAWTPGTRSPVTKKSALEKALAALGSMSAEEKAEFARRLNG